MTANGTEEAADEEGGTLLINTIATRLGGGEAGLGVREGMGEIGMGTGIRTGPTGIGEVTLYYSPSFLLY